MAQHILFGMELEPFHIMLATHWKSNPVWEQEGVAKGKTEIGKMAPEAMVHARYYLSYI